MTLEDKEFDARIRACLGEAREEVPEELWATLEQRLETGAAAAGGATNGATNGAKGGDARKGAVLPFLRAAAGLMAVAAALAAVVLLHHGGRVAAPVRTEEAVQAPLAQVLPETDATSAPVRPEAKPAVVAPKRTPARPAQEKADTDSGQVLPVPESHHEPESRTAGPAGSKGSAAWPSEEPVRKKFRRSVALTARGDLMNNATKTSSFRIGPKAAPGSPGASSTTLTKVGKQSSQGIPLSAGLGVRVRVAPRWSLGSGVDYTFLSQRFNGTYTHVEGGIVTERISADVIHQQHFVGIPLTAYFDIFQSDFVQLYAHAGGKMEKCVANRFRILAPGEDRFHKESVRGFQFSAGVGLGVEFRITQHVGIYADPVVRYYFDNGQPSSFRTQDPLRIGLDIGFRFALGK